MFPEKFMKKVIQTEIVFLQEQVDLAHIHTMLYYVGHILVISLAIDYDKR